MLITTSKTRRYSALFLAATLFALLALLVRPYKMVKPAFASVLTLQEGVDGYAGTTDNFLDSWAMTSNWGDSVYLKVRHADIRKPVIKFDLTGQIPDNSTINSATLAVYAIARSNSNSLTVGSFKILRSWEEGESTWAKASTEIDWGTAGCNNTSTDREATASYTTTLATTGTWFEWDVTDMTQDWVDNPTSNKGIALMYVTSSGSVEYMGISSEHPNLAKRPKLTIDYTDPSTPTPTPTAGPSPTPTPTPTPTPAPGPSQGNEPVLGLIQARACWGVLTYGSCNFASQTVDGYQIDLTWDVADGAGASIAQLIKDIRANRTCGPNSDHECYVTLTIWPINYDSGVNTARIPGSWTTYNLTTCTGEIPAFDAVVGYQGKLVTSMTAIKNTLTAEGALPDVVYVSDGVYGESAPFRGGACATSGCDYDCWRGRWKTYVQWAMEAYRDVWGSDMHLIWQGSHMYLWGPDLEEIGDKAQAEEIGWQGNGWGGQYSPPTYIGEAHDAVIWKDSGAIRTGKYQEYEDQEGNVPLGSEPKHIVGAEREAIELISWMASYPNNVYNVQKENLTAFESYDTPNGEHYEDVFTRLTKPEESIASSALYAFCHPHRARAGYKGSSTLRSVGWSMWPGAEDYTTLTGDDDERLNICRWLTQTTDGKPARMACKPFHYGFVAASPAIDGYCRIPPNGAGPNFDPGWTEAARSFFNCDPAGAGGYSKCSAATLTGLYTMNFWHVKDKDGDDWPLGFTTSLAGVGYTSTVTATLVYTGSGGNVSVANCGNTDLVTVTTWTETTVGPWTCSKKPGDLQVTAPSGGELLVAHIEIEVSRPQAYSPYDFDCDCDIDVVDIVEVASRWDCECGDDCYNSLYDLDDDCDIDVVDIMKIVARWACECGEACYDDT